MSHLEHVLKPELGAVQPQHAAGAAGAPVACTTTRWLVCGPSAVMHMATLALMASAFCGELAESGCSTMMVPALLAATCSDSHT